MANTISVGGQTVPVPAQPAAASSDTSGILGGLSGQVGLGGGAGGTSFQAPQAYQLQQTISPQQIQQGNVNAQSGVSGLGALYNALNPNQAITQQQGATNALGILAAQTAPMGLQGAGYQGQATSGLGGLTNALQYAGGVGTQNNAVNNLGNVFNSQGSTLGQLQGIANGTGPNPAQAMLAQQTGQNVSNQAALMAGQRGAGANVGLMARQAAQQGAATQQQAVGQGATMQAQQSLGALGQMGTQQQGMANTAATAGGLGTTQVGQQISGLGQLSAQGQAMLGSAQYTAGQYAGQTNTNVAQPITVGNQYAQAANQNQANALGAAGNLNTAGVGMQSNINTANAGMASTQIANQPSNLGTIASGAAALGTLAVNGLGSSGTPTNEGSPMTAPTETDTFAGNPQASYNTNTDYISGNPYYSNPNLARGGLVKAVRKFADGGVTEAPVVPIAPIAPVSLGSANTDNSSQPQSSFGQYLQSLQGQQQLQNYNQTQQQFQSNTQAAPQTVMPSASTQNYRANQAAAAAADASDNDPSGMLGFFGNIAAMAPVVGGPLSSAIKNAAYGGKINHDYRSGGPVKATSRKEKAVKSGNSYSNDKVPAMLSEGEIVVPRSVLQSRDPVRASADFVRKTLSKSRRK